MNTVEDRIPHNECCGCTGCMSICPNAAITMEADNQGFLYPTIDHSKCIECGLCVKVCKGALKMHRTAGKCFAVKNSDAEVLEQSSSGGVSYALCNVFISNGGAVYGVAFDEVGEKVVTRKAESLNECKGFYGSKYVQTDLQDSFKRINEDLSIGRPVLFFGTSCHVAGLLSFLQIKKCCTDKLLTVDFACHGVPSPVLFKEYIQFLKRDKQFEKFAFRTKNTEWGNGSKGYGCSIYYKNGKREVDTPKARLFLKLFFSNNCLRPHCYECPYASVEKPADLTMADYWGVKEIHPDFFSKKGVSAVICRSKKALDFIRKAEELIKLPTQIDSIVNRQANLRAPSSRGDNYERFWEMYYQKGFLEMAKSGIGGGYSLSSRIKYRIKKMLRK